MTDPYQKVSPGERLTIPAAAWNKMLDSIAVPVRTGGELGSMQPAPNTVLVKNDSGADLERFGVLGITGPVINPMAGPTQLADFQRRPAMRGVAVTAGLTEKFVVALEPIKNGSFGLAAASGVFAAKVRLLNTSHRFAQAYTGETQLRSAACGPVMLLWVGATGVTGSTGPTGPNKHCVVVM